MFEQIYEHPHALARHRNGPMADERRRFLIERAARGESRDQLRQTASLLLRTIDRLDLPNRPTDHISREELVQKSALCCSSISTAVQWFRFLGRLETPVVPVNPYANAIDAFVDYMRCESGAAESTIQARSRFLRRFLVQLHTPIVPLREFTVAQIDEALLRMVNQKGYTRGSVRTWAATLRSFFRYAAAQNLCPRSLADAIRSPRQFTQASLPSGLSWNDVQRLLKLTEGDRPLDIRDRPILMLLAIYGLRAGEVCRLTLDDFHWEHELLSIVCPKTRRTRSYPLIRSVGDAVLRYLQEARPRSAHREVFLRSCRPVGPLRNAMFWIVNSRLKRLGLTLRHYGPHALRHSCAAHLLAHGLSLKEIGDHLGHQHPDTTRVYAKVDLAGLRQVADFDLGGLL
jgi:site-specific recombinase XerD